MPRRIKPRTVFHNQRTAWDTFGGPDGQSLDLHVPNKGGAWTLNAGVWTLSGGKTITTAANGITSVATMESGHADVRIKATCTFVTNGSVGLCGRFSNLQNYWYARFLNNALSIFEVASNTTTQRASTTIAAVAGTDYTLEVQFRGSVIIAVFNNATTLTYAGATTNLYATRVGLRAAGSGGTATGIGYDDLEVAPL